jgi:hypothetical protein
MYSTPIKNARQSLKTTKSLLELRIFQVLITMAHAAGCVVHEQRQSNSLTLHEGGIMPV